MTALRSACESAVGLALVALLLTGCGAKPTTIGAPAYVTDQPTATATASSGLDYPNLELTFQLPAHLKPAQKAAARAYIRFQVALQRALRTDKVGADLMRMTATSAQQLIRNDITTYRKIGGSPGQTIVRIDTITLKKGDAGFQVCSLSADGHKPAVALMIPEGGRLRTSIIGPDHSRSSC